MDSKSENAVIHMCIESINSNAACFSQAVDEIFTGNIYKIFFALKSHDSDKVISALKPYGFGLEVINTVQLQKSNLLKFPTIVSGFVKSDTFLLKSMLKCDYVIIESDSELLRILDFDEVVLSKANFLIRIKIDSDSKMGCSEELVNRILYENKIKIKGLHFHAGWNERSDTIIKKYLAKMAQYEDIFLRNGFSVKVLNFGGSYCEKTADPNQLKQRLNLLKQYKYLTNEKEVHFEPGRYIVGNAGFLIANIISVDILNKRIAVDTCAYGYKLNGGTPKVSLARPEKTSTNISWKIDGFWSTEGDCLSGVYLNGIPEVGSSIIFHNMGAYILGMESQFSVNGSIKVMYVEKYDDQLEIN